MVDSAVDHRGTDDLVSEDAAQPVNGRFAASCSTGR